jgi:hypothetical protein
MTRAKLITHAQAYLLLASPWLAVLAGFLLGKVLS